MMVFWIILVFMIAAGMLMLVPALLGKKNSTAEGNRQQNISIARERMRELEAELQAGTLSKEIYQQTLDELEKGLMIDIDEGEMPESGQPASSKKILISVFLIVPVLSLGLYQVLGSPQYLEVSGPGNHSAAVAVNKKAGKLPSIPEMIKDLTKKTENNPDDPDAWYLLGRLYASTNEFEKSVDAYKKLVVVSDRQPTALVVLADSLAMTQGGRLSGEPIKLVNEALEKEPGHTTALWMAGQAAANKNEYENAVNFWRRASHGLKDNKEMRDELNGMITEAVLLAKQAGIVIRDDTPTAIASDAHNEAASNNPGFAIDVTIAPELLNQIKENDVLFIFARAVDGPPMPLAAIKRQARELPVSITLDDGSMLRPGISFSQFKQIKLGAKVTHSGQPIAQSGDLQSDVLIVDTGAEERILLHIDKLIP